MYELNVQSIIKLDLKKGTTDEKGWLPFYELLKLPGGKIKADRKLK
jgi:hypothetical protein